MDNRTLNNQPVMSGKILDTIKKLSTGLLKSFNKLLDYGLDISSGDMNDDGSVNWTITDGSGNEIKMVQMPLFKNHKKTGRYDLEFNWEKGNKHDIKENVSESNIDKVITTLLEDWTESTFESKHNDDTGEDIEPNTNPENSEDANSNTKIKATFKKVTSGTEPGIYLTAVTANCNVNEAESVLDTILSDDNFISQIDENPVSYSIVDEGDNFDVNVTDLISTDELNSETFNALLTNSYLALMNIQTVHWNSIGSNFNHIHSLSDSYIGELRDEIDQLAEMAVEYCNNIDHPYVLLSKYINSSSNVISIDNFLHTGGYTADIGFEFIKNVLEEYISVLEFYYVNVDPDVQSVFDNWIRHWKKQSNYIIKQVLK